MVNPTSGEANPLQALSDQLAEAIAQASPSVVAVNARRRYSSSGIHWQPGLIITADHTVKRDEDITITLADGQTRPATVMGRDSGTDLALLRVQEPDFPVVARGEATSLKAGHLVMAIARSSEGNVSASMGIISALGGTWRTWYGGHIDQFIRPDLSLYPGFSGGPLIDPQGHVLGINTSGPRDLALTIPTTTIGRVVEQWSQKGRISRGYLGVGMQPVRLPERLRTAFNLSQYGVLIVSLEPDAPADQAGVLLGDILLALNDMPITDVGDVQMMLGPEQVGQSMRAKLLRGGALVELAIAVGERP